MKKLQSLLVCSLLVNLMFFGLAGYVIERRGGISYLVSLVTASSEAPARYIESPLYHGRKSNFASLPRDDGAVIFAGDSITDFARWSELLQYPVLNRGIAGDTIEGLRQRMDEILKHQPSQLFIMIGVNDLNGGATSRHLFIEYGALIEEIKTTSPQTQIFLQSILPVNIPSWRAATGWDLPPEVTQSILEVNEALSDIADGNQILYIDLYSELVADGDLLDEQYTSDGLHLNGAGYLKWRDVVLPYLEPNLVEQEVL
ncbi:MAG: GDSL-type esterase/lipase family protein [Opitutales bacterium]